MSARTMVGILLSLPLLGGCSVSLGPYQAPRYDPYRPQGASEPVIIHTESTPPIQWIPVEDTGQGIQGIPVVMELSADHPAMSWRALAGRFRVYELQLNDGQFTRADSFDVYPVTRLDEEADGSATTRTDILSNHPGVQEGDMDLVETTGEATLERMTALGLDGAQVLLLVCPGTDQKPRCVVPGRAYELHVFQGGEADLAAANTPNPTSGAVIYPFRVENRSIPVTVLTGTAVILAVLYWAAG